MNPTQISVFIISLFLSAPAQKIDPFSLVEKGAFPAKVSSVAAGDLIAVLLDENSLISVRLAEVDSPESRQPFFQQAVNFTEELAKGKTVTVLVKGVDRHQRVIGEVVLPDGRNLNQELVKWGYAWHYNVAFTPSKILADLEYQAWKAKLGLWVDVDPVPPWKFRADSTAPEVPSTYSRMDYEDIFRYGLFGNRKTRTYQWPECKGYKPPPPEDRIVFSHMMDAESKGYHEDKTCRKQEEKQRKKK